MRHCCDYVGCVGTFVPFDIYLVVLNSTTSINGVELSYRFETPPGLNTQPVILATHYPQGGLNVCSKTGPLSGDICAGWNEALPPGDEVQVVRWTLMSLDPSTTMKIYIGPSRFSQTPLIATGESIVPIPVWSGHYDEPCAFVNFDIQTPVMQLCFCDNAVPVLPSTFGTIKALYR